MSKKHNRRALMASQAARADRAEAALASVAEQARKERDFEWWQELALVDNVAPEPKEVKKWLLHLAKHEQAEAKAEGYEVAARIADRVLSACSTRVEQDIAATIRNLILDAAEKSR